MDPFVLCLRLESLIEHKFGRRIRATRGLLPGVASEALARLPAFTWVAVVHDNPDLPIAMAIREFPGAPAASSSPLYEVMELRRAPPVRVTRWRLDRKDGWIEI